MNEIAEIQENLTEWFKDIDDKTLVGVIDCLVYHNGTQDKELSELIKKFLDENELNDAYATYLMEINSPQKYFRRDPVSVGFIEDMKVAFLSLAYNRLSKKLNKPKPTLENRLSKDEKRDLKMVIEFCETRNDDLIQDEATTRLMFEKEEADELIDERNRLSKLFTKVLKIIK